MLSGLCYNLFSYHETQLYYSYRTSTIVASFAPEPFQLDLYCKIDNAKIAFFIIDDLKIFWLKFDDVIHNLGYFLVPYYYNYRELKEEKIAVEIALDKYLCVGPNGRSALRNVIRQWEEFKLVAAI